MGTVAFCAYEEGRREALVVAGVVTYATPSNRWPRIEVLDKQ